MRFIKRCLIAVGVLCLMSMPVMADSGDLYVETDESGVEHWYTEEGKEVNPYEIDQVSLNEIYDMAYRIEDMPEVRNQGGYGTCWAQGAISSLESNLIKAKGENSSIDLSERHLVYFAHKRNEALGDGLDKFTTDQGYYGPGSMRDVIKEFGSHYGAALESDYPYLSTNSAETIDESLRTVCNYEVSDFLFYSDGTSYNIDAVKEAIITHGAVACSFFYSEIYLSDDSGYYCPSDSDENHAISIVGWDDNFPAAKLGDGTNPAHNGAWICRNSYGTEFGVDGYFYLSYEDKSIADMVSVLAATTNHPYVAQYDGAGYGGTLTSYSATANIFCAEKDADLTAVSFYTFADHEAYEIEVYVSNAPMSSPIDGTLACTTKGSIDHYGYSTVALNKPVMLREGMYYSVIVTPTNSDGTVAKQAVELSVKVGGTYSASEGQSYGYKQGEWYDFVSSGTKIGVQYVCNTCIKALLTPAVRTSGASIKASKTSLFPGETTTYKVSVSPSTATCKDYDILVSDKSVIAVENGVITALKTGSSTVTVTPKDGGTAAKITVKVVAPSSTTITKYYKKTKTSVALKWGTVKNASGYYVYRKMAGESGYKKIKTITSGATVSYVDATVTNGKIYYYLIKPYVKVNGVVTKGANSPSVKLDLSKLISSDELSLNYTKLTMSKGTTKQLTVKYPKGRSSTQIVSKTYTSSNKSYVTVSSSGKVKAVKKGSAVITTTVKLKNGQKKKLTTKVTVK